MQPAAASPLPPIPTGVELRRIPLVARLLDDPAVKIVRRGVDQDWYYSGHATSAAGWNPWVSEIYVGERSAVADFLRDPSKDLRALNEGDLLVPELLFGVHDYLHAWAVRVLAELAPDYALGAAPITEQNVESLAFLALLTEVVATVGLDYWYLSCTDLEDVLGIGTNLKTLTTSYHEDDIEEYRRAYPALNVQDPAFFFTLARLYLTGIMAGFTNDALKRSPKTFIWLQKELRYAVEQRVYARTWLQHLSGRTLYSTKSQLGAPVPCQEPWQRELIDRMAELSWQLVKKGAAAPTPSAPARADWAAPQIGPIDCRFTNLSRFADPRREVSERGIVAESFPCLFAQVLSWLEFDASGKSLAPCLSALKASGSPELVFEFFGHYPRLEAEADTPLDLFFLG